MFYFVFFSNMKLILIQIMLISTFNINGQRTRNLAGNRMIQEVVFAPPETGIRQITRHSQPSTQHNDKNNYVLIIHNLFGNGDKTANKLIFAPGAAMFVQPSQLIKHERNTVTSHKTEIKSTFGQFESKIVHSSETTSKTQSNPVFDNHLINPYHLSSTGNMFNDDGINNDNSFPSIQSESNNALMQPVDNKNVLQNSFQDSVNKLDQRFGWNEQLERWKWLKALQEAKSKPKSVTTDSPVVSNSKNTTRTKNPKTFGLAPIQELVKPYKELGTLGPYKSETAPEDKQFLDLITQGLHPLQEIVVDKPKQRTDSDGTQAEGFGEVPGLHSLQAFSNLETTEKEPFQGNLRNPIGSNMLQSYEQNFMQSVYKKPLFGPKPKRDTVQISGDLPSKTNEPDSFMLSSEYISTNLRQPSKLQKSPNGFGLNHGINNHPNIFNFFSTAEKKSDPAFTSISGEQNIIAPVHNIDSPAQITTDLSSSTPTVNIADTAGHFTERKRNGGWNSHRGKIIPILSTLPQQQGSLSDMFPVDMNTLPALEMVAHYLPVATMTRKLHKTLRDTLPVGALLNKFGSKAGQPRALLPWVSNILLPALSLNSIIEKNIREKSSYVNMQGRLIDKVTETSTRHRLNITHQFKPFIKTAMTEQVNFKTKQFPKSVSLLVSRSKSTPMAKSSNTKSNWNRNINTNRLRSPVLSSSRRPRKSQTTRQSILRPRRQRWGRQQIPLLPVQIRG